jgi:hypothetical protein
MSFVEGIPGERVAVSSPDSHRMSPRKEVV